MEKYLVEVSLPAANLVYDLFVPELMQVGMVARLAASVFAKLSGGSYTPGLQNVLCEKTTGLEFDPNALVRDTTIRNGTRLILY